MLDPDPERRITTRQMITMLGRAELLCSRIVGLIVCLSCRVLSTEAVDLNVLVHSSFFHLSNIAFPRDLEQALVDTTVTDWESMKRKWMQQNMWW